MVDRRPGRRAAGLCILAIACSFVVTSCTQHTMYRRSPPYDIKMEPGVDLSVIELDDHGEFWDRAQLDYALGKIGAAQQGPGAGAIVITFVHGWNNNASRGNEDDPSGNLFKFKETLRQVARLERSYAARAPRPIIGVYVAWRGEAIHPWLQFLTFYSRYSAAQKVGSGPAVAETLMAIAGLVRSNPLSQSVIVGHSFGGLIVEKALSQIIAGMATRAVFGGPRPGGSFVVASSEFPANLLVLVNPASPALFARSELSAIEHWQLSAKEKVDADYVCKGSPTWRPLIVSITSTGDWATGLAFPIGTSVGYAFERYRRYGSNMPGTPPVDQARHSQRYYYTHTEGHIAEIHSHSLSLDQPAGKSEAIDIHPCPGDPCANQNTLCYVAGNSLFKIVRNDQSLNRGTPYWIMPSPTSIIANHTDIFNPTFRNMLAGLLEVMTILPSANPAARTAPPAGEPGAAGGSASPGPSGGALVPSILQSNSLPQGK